MICLIDNLPIYYEEYGQGKPALFIHGFSIDHRCMKGCMEPIFERFDGYRRIYLDLPGMGQTPGLGWVKNADVMLDIIKKFIARIIKDENFLIAGNSYGGYMALGLAHEMSAQIDGLFLLAPCTVGDTTLRKLPVREDVVIEESLEEHINSKEDFENFLACAAIATKETWNRFANEIMPGINIADAEFLRVYRQRGFSFSFEDELKSLNFNNPTVALTGRQDDSVGYQDTWDTVKHLPRLTFVVLDNAGHNLQIEHVDIFEAHVAEWLRVT
jgi:pimeloyl-ACP methyl ester carboxylesterase